MKITWSSLFQGNDPPEMPPRLPAQPDRLATKLAGVGNGNHSCRQCVLRHAWKPPLVDCSRQLAHALQRLVGADRNILAAGVSVGAGHFAEMHSRAPRN